MISRQLLPASDVQRKLPVNYDTMYAGKEMFIRPSEHFDPVSLYTVSDAYVSPYGVVFKNGRVVRESVYGMFDPKKQWPSFIKKILLGRTVRIGEPVLVAHHAYYENYFHWLCEIMPRIFVASRNLGAEKTNLLLHERQPRFVREFLSLFDFRRIIPIKDMELARVPEVNFPGHIARPLAYHEGLMREMSAWLIDKLNDPASTGSPEKIFISRKNARYRITEHEDEIQAFLVSRGFVVLSPEEFSVREQMNLFKNARIIIGSHGAGFSNLLFAPRCELIVDIIHQEHPQDCFYNLAAAFDISYYYFQCPGKGRLTFKNNDDVVADPKSFIREVSPLI